MISEPVVVLPWTDLRHFVEDFVYRYHRKAFPVGADGRLEGYVSTQVLAEHTRATSGRRHTVGRGDASATSRPLSIAPAADDALKALGKMQRTGAEPAAGRRGRQRSSASSA